MKISPFILVLLSLIACKPDADSSSSSSLSGSIAQPIFRSLNLNSNRIHLQIPSNWTHLRKVYVLGPDCAICSGSEYEYIVGTPDSTSLISVEVEVFPAGDNRFRSAAQELKSAFVKDPQATMIDTLTDAAQQTDIVYMKSWRNRKAVYFATKKIVSPYRTLLVYVQTPKTVDNMALIKSIMKTVTVDKAYMALPYK